jgi:hypothetical protein
VTPSIGTKCNAARAAPANAQTAIKKIADSRRMRVLVTLGILPNRAGGAVGRLRPEVPAK